MICTRTSTWLSRSSGRPGGLGDALNRSNNDDKARDYVARLNKNVPVLDFGARGATIMFAQRDIGDGLLA
jgi:ABC-type sulfate transport system substrate-binding protein